MPAPAHNNLNNHNTQNNHAFDFAAPPIDDLIHHIDDDVVEHRHRWPKALCELSDFVQAQLKNTGVSEQQQINLADKVLLAMAMYSGGRGFYLPNAKTTRDFIRNRRIYQAFTGRNHKELAHQYRMSEIRIYQIIKEQRAMDVARRQPGLWG